MIEAEMHKVFVPVLHTGFPENMTAPIVMLASTCIFGTRDLALSAARTRFSPQHPEVARIDIEEWTLMLTEPEKQALMLTGLTLAQAVGRTVESPSILKQGELTPLLLN